MMRRLPTLLLTTIILAPLPALAQPTPPQAIDGPVTAFTGSDLFKLEAARDPQISPDGRQIAYVRQTGDVMTNRNRASIWPIDVATAKQRPLVTGAGRYGQPRWSPVGTRLAYISSDEGGAQLAVRWLGSGTASRQRGLPHPGQ